MEMVKMFQLQLEHYEKVEGNALSLEGKANQLSAMVRGNLACGDAGDGRRPDLSLALTSVAVLAGCGTSMPQADATRSEILSRRAPVACMPAR